MDELIKKVQELEKRVAELEREIQNRTTPEEVGEIYESLRTLDRESIPKGGKIRLGKTRLFCEITD